MLFLSRERSPSLLMVPGYEEIVQTVHGNIPRVQKPKFLKFTPLAEGQQFEAPGLPTKWNTGKAQGYLETEYVANQMGVEEKEVIDFLLSHPSHGVEFVGIGGEGEEIENDDVFFIPEGDGGFFCKLCETHLKNAQGVAGHKTSNAHQENVAIARRAMSTALKAV